MSYYPEPQRHIRVKFKVVLDVSVNSDKKGSEHATGIDTSDLAAKCDFVALKIEVDI